MAGDLDSWAAIIELWESAAELGRDLKDVTDISVRAWKVRGIPGSYWEGVVAAAARRGYQGVTLELCARLAARAAGRRKPRAIEAGATA